MSKRALLHFAIAVVAAVLFQGSASASVPIWWCMTGDGRICLESELADPVRFRQIVVFPSGFRTGEESAFRDSYEQLLESVTRLPADVYSSSYRSQLLYIGVWLPGAALGKPGALFSGAILKHPTRGKALALRLQAVQGKVEELRKDSIPQLRPWSVLILFNTLESEITANAAPPSFLGTEYGIAKVTRLDIRAHYAPMHELAHSGLNYLDEYVEPGFEKMNINSLDYLTPLGIAGQDWGSLGTVLGSFLGGYDYRLSEVLAANGNDNIDTSRYPSRVATAGYAPNEYEKEGGMLFGIGTHHDQGRNVMGDGSRVMPSDDGFGFGHSASQREIIEQAFVNAGEARRPNDRLRNSGPLKAWSAVFGSNTQLLFFDADKNHHFHSTRFYEVQVGWYERNWKVCWKWKFLPYPCSTEKWLTVQKSVRPTRRTILLKSSFLYGLAGVIQNLACDLGIKQIRGGGSSFDLCSLTLDQMTGAFVPSMEFAVPYQNVEVPASQWFTKYHWRFRTDNGSFKSGYTGWSSFFRVF